MGNMVQSRVGGMAVRYVVWEGGRVYARGLTNKAFALGLASMPGRVLTIEFA